MKVIKTEDMRVPIKTWCENPEASALNQAIRLAKLPFSFRHIAAMPDMHAGFGMPIGGVLATKNVIIPNAVGVDIGCGMCSIESNITDWVKEDLKQVIKKLQFSVPVGFGRHIKPKDFSKLPQPEDPAAYYYRFLEAATYQLGTLGGGNHFIEFQKNTKGNLCIMIHSGSRNIGKQVADFFNKKAKEINERYFSSIPSDWGLSFLPLDSEEGQQYLKEMNYCVEFALANRQEMMRSVEGALYTIFKPRGRVDFTNFINIPHNYARLENHFGENVVVHRKGSTSAKLNEIGLIPGSQGTKSYCVRGLGNKESFASCSHGAGRKMGRAEARRSLDIGKELEHLKKLDIIHAIKSEHDLDEAPGSYKDIDVVMKEQADLVEIVDEFTPLAVIKSMDNKRR
jgi:tRNA-splicing ligase RtcB